MKAIDYSKLTERTCSKCKQTKSVSEFSKDNDPSQPINGWRYRSWCKECSNERSRKYSVENREKRNARLRRWRRDNPDLAHKLDRRRGLKRNYGMTVRDYDSMYEKQDGQCLICERKKDKLAVDHNHTTGEVRGLLCNKCNSVLGWIETMPNVWDNLYDYINNLSYKHIDQITEGEQSEKAR